MSKDQDDQARKQRADQFRKYIDDAVHKRGSPQSPNEFIDREMDKEQKKPRDEGGGCAG